METLIVDKLPRITKNRRKLEKKLEVTITNRGREVSIEGKPENEYVALKVVGALDFGFPFSVALLIKERDYMFEVISIKEHTKKKNLERIRGRIIGTKGKTLKTLSELTKCYFEIKDNKVGIVGDPEYVQNAQNGIISLIKGAKQSNVYSSLEKNQVKPIVDLGLKKGKKEKE